MNMKRHGSSFAMALAGLFVLLSGCTESRLPADPAAPVTEPGSPPPPPHYGPLYPSLVFPAVSAPERVYDRVTPHFYTARSRFLLHPDGTFKLQFLTSRSGFLEYPGYYHRTDSVISFAFSGWSVAGPWEAVGTVQGDSLTVRYNIIMSLSDFEDGVYVLAP